MKWRYYKHVPGNTLGSSL